MDKVSITPMTKKADRVNAARVLIPRVEFSDKCEKGLEGLRSWAYEYNEDTKTFSSDPKHDWASHDGDGFSYGCIVMRMTNPPVKKEPMKLQHEYTMSDLIKASDMATPRKGRI